MRQHNWLVGEQPLSVPMFLRPPQKQISSSARGGNNLSMTQPTVYTSSVRTQQGFSQSPLLGATFTLRSYYSYRGNNHVRKW